MKLTSNNFALQAFVPSHSFAGAVTGTRLKAALTHRSSRPVFSVRALPTSGQFCVFCKMVTTMLKYVEPSRTILSGRDEIKWSFGPIVQSRDQYSASPGPC